jgi:hypothetical protein
MTFPKVPERRRVMLGLRHRKSQQSAEVSSDDDDDEHPAAHSQKRAFTDNKDDSSSSFHEEEESSPTFLTIGRPVWPVPSPNAKKLKKAKLPDEDSAVAMQKNRNKGQLAKIALNAASNYENLYSEYSSIHDKYNAAKKRLQISEKETGQLQKRVLVLQEKLQRAEQSAAKHKQLSLERKKEVATLDESLRIPKRNNVLDWRRLLRPLKKRTAGSLMREARISAQLPLKLKCSTARNPI